MQLIGGRGHRSFGSYMLCHCQHCNVREGRKREKFCNKNACFAVDNDDRRFFLMLYPSCSISPRDKENLAVISDHGITEQLSLLANHHDDMLRAKLALAIGKWMRPFI